MQASTRGFDLWEKEGFSFNMFVSETRNFKRTGDKSNAVKPAPPLSVHNAGCAWVDVGIALLLFAWLLARTKYEV